MTDLAFTHNILFLHTENPRVGRTRSGSLVPETSPLLLHSSGSPANGRRVKVGVTVKGEGNAATEKNAAEGGSGVAIQISEWDNLAFLLISFGYMVPWTSLGSLISYFKHTYNAEFYNKLYCAYYLPGLPVAILQHKYDGYVDAQIGSRNAYMLRGVISFIIMIAILILMVWWREQRTLIFLFVILGIFSWLCHGTASMLASMYPATAIAYLQTGFRCPEIYTIVIVAALNIGSHPSDHDLDLFFGVTAAIVACSLGVWLYVAGGSASRRLFDLKDARMSAHLASDTIDEKDEGARESDPLLASASASAADMENSGYASIANATISVDVEDAAEHDLGMLTSEPTGGSATEISRVSRLSPSRSRLGVRDRKVSNRSGSQTAALGAANPGSLAHSLGLRIRTKQVLRAVEDASMRNTVYRKVFSLCLALFITIWCSIFQASFFAYCDSPQGRDIEQILYFVRLFSDLLGRPLTRLTRPWFLLENHHVLNASIIRILLMGVFFLYIFIPTFPRYFFSLVCKFLFLFFSVLL